MKHFKLKTYFATVLLVGVCAVDLRAANLTWDADTVTTGAQDGAGNWNSVGSNWWDGSANATWNSATPDNAIFGAGSGAAGVITVPTSTTNTVGNITFNAPGSGGYNIAAGSATTSKINLSGTPTITVASGVSATNLVVLTGTSFTKLGAGLFVLKPGAANINSGPTVVGGGTLSIGGTAGRLVIPGNLTITNGGIALMGQSEQIADAGIVTVDGGTYDSGGKSETIGGFILDNNGQVLSASSSQAITNNGSVYDLRSGVFFPNLAGTAGLNKTTVGTVILTNGGGANTFSGPVVISTGILDLGHSGVGNGLPGVLVTITNTGMLRQGKDTQIQSNATVNVAGGTYELLGHNETVSAVILANNGSILNTGSTSKTLTVLTNMDFRSGLCASRLAGAGVMVKSTAGTVTLSLDNANSGGTVVSGGVLQLGDGSANRGSFGSGPVTNNAAVVLNHNGAFTLTNPISGSGSLTNLGGSPSLIGANTYSGGTTVSAGTLFVNNLTGSGTGSGAVKVESGATLGGTGIVGGTANIQSGANLSPGNGGTGTLTISGALTLNSSSISAFDVDGSTPTNDSVVLGSSVTYGGTLNITPTGVFTAGQQFVLFSGAGATNASNFASITGSPGVDLAFTFNNGVLSVVSTGSTPPQLNVSRAGSTLTFSWSGAGFKLQSQTNNLSTGLNGVWGDYPDTSNPVNVAIDPTKPTVYFRLSQ
jgi:fibronectin-binding autotransporter adhesin